MGFFARIKFLFGIFVVLAILGGLFLLLNYRMSNVTSRKAALQADAYSISADYAGVLRRILISPGETVDAGDRLFEISSPGLTQAIRNEQVKADSPLYEILDNGDMVLLATAPGVVQQINFTSGAYIEANIDIASVATKNARYVTAYYLLSAPDYARINRENHVKVVLPDNSQYDANIFDISLEQDEEQVFTVVKARLPEDAEILQTFTSGTPVTTTWQLDNSDWQNSLIQFVRSLIEPRTQGS